MRVTNRMIQVSALESIQQNMSGLSVAQSRVASGRKLQRASDAPSDAAAAMVARGGLRALEQFHSAVNHAGQRASMEEAVLGGLSETLVRAKEIAITQAQPGSDATRSAARAEVEQLLRHAVSLANTAFGEGYLFAGTAAAAPPYGIVETPGGVDFASTAPSGEHRVAISVRQEIVTNRPGKEVFDDTGALAVLRELATALASNDPEQVRARLPELDASLDAVENLVGDVGARMNQLQITRTTMEGLELSLQRFRSDVEEVEMEEAILEMAGRQTALQAAMMATSRVMGLTLANYL